MRITLTHHLGSGRNIQCQTSETHLEQDMATMKKLLGVLEDNPVIEDIGSQAQVRAMEAFRVQVEGFHQMAAGETEPSEQGRL